MYPDKFRQLTEIPKTLLSKNVNSRLRYWCTGFWTLTMRRLRVIVWFKCLIFFVKLVVVDRILDWKIIENTVNHGRNIWNTLHFIKRIRDHSFSTYAKFSEKLTFLTPWWHSWNPPPPFVKGRVGPSKNWVTCDGTRFSARKGG